MTSRIFFGSTSDVQFKNYINAVQASLEVPNDSSLKILSCYHYAGCCTTTRTFHDQILEGVIKYASTIGKAQDVMNCYLQYVEYCRYAKAAESDLLSEVRCFFDCLDSKEAAYWLPITLLTQTVISQNDYTPISEADFIERLIKV